MSLSLIDLSLLIPLVRQELGVLQTLITAEDPQMAQDAMDISALYRQTAAKLKEDPKFPERNILGTGPFTFVEHVKGSHVVGKKNASYWDKGKPYLDGVEFRIVTSRATRVLAFVAGEFDLSVGSMMSLAGCVAVMLGAAWLPQVILFLGLLFDDPKPAEYLNSFAIKRT